MKEELSDIRTTSTENIKFIKEISYERLKYKKKAEDMENNFSNRLYHKWKEDILIPEDR